MCKVYFEDRVFRFVTSPACACGVIIDNPSRESLNPAKMLEIPGNSKDICIIAGDPLSAFRDFSSWYRIVPAAGGLVKNRDGELLMIFRNGHWDLPKGHVEDGESPEEGAVREVREETGLEKITGCGFLTDSYHIYKLDGQWILKRTSWYLMESCSEKLVPQSEEGISEAVWVAPGEVAGYAKGAYRSIISVMETAGLL